MPQGDIHFFPYDAVVILTSFIGGYCFFVGLLVPRLFLTLKARNLLATASFERSTATSSVVTRSGNRSIDYFLAAVTFYPVATSETFLSFIQFTLLLTLIFNVASNNLHASLTKISTKPKNSLSQPTFQVGLTTTTNLLLLWFQNRSHIFAKPAVYALFQVTQHVLNVMRNRTSPLLLPRLLAVVKDASKGLKNV